MKKFALLILSFAVLQVFAQDSLATKTRKSQNIGFCVGMDYSIIRFESVPYFADSAGKVGHSNAENGLGGSAGAFYNVKIGRYFLLRPAVEAHLLTAKIKYDTDIDHRQTADIFPVAIETPIALVFSKNITEDFPASSKTYPEFGVAVRPVFAMTGFNDMKPTFKDKNLNLDVSLGMPYNVKKSKIRTELFFSYGLFNLIGEDDTDFKTYTVNYVGRSFAGLRFYIN
jgi:hypothetical protein